MNKAIINRFNSIQVKVVILFMILALFTVATTAVIIINYEKSNSIVKEQYRLESIAEILGPALTATVVFNDEVTASELMLPLMSDQTIIDARVELDDNRLFVKVNSPYTHIDDLATEHLSVSRKLTHDGSHYGSLIIRANDSAISKHISVYTLFISFIAAITLTISFILSLVFSRYIIKPISNLSRLAKQVTETNNYALRSNVTAHDEIGVLSQAFNQMLQQIELRDSNLERQVKQRTNELQLVNEQLSRQAYQDSLLDMPNRRFFSETLQTLVDQYEREVSVGFSILFLDLDGFKEVNDTLGHDYGDLLLVAVSKRLNSAKRKSDLLARLGGDEFTILISDVVDEKVASRVAKEIHQALRAPFFIHGEEISITGSIGIALFPNNGSSVEAIMKSADLAMYEAKAEGRNCFRYFDDSMMQRLIDQREVVADLKVALLDDQLEIHYQPIVDLNSGSIVKVEALVRWKHPVKGLIYPNDFIQLAEEFGIINDIGEWVLLRALKDWQTLSDAFGCPIQISVNVSPAQFKTDFSWATSFLKQLHHCGIEPKHISFEITENLLMSSDDIVKERLKQLKKAGIQIAIDDFGVGYSSLSYLQQIEVDILKIDRSFVQHLTVDINSQTLCKAMINMAKELGICVVAEGVEEQKHAEILAQFGCTLGQGYYFAKPMPISMLITNQLTSECKKFG